MSAFLCTPPRRYLWSWRANGNQNPMWTMTFQALLASAFVSWFFPIGRGITNPLNSQPLCVELSVSWVLCLALALLCLFKPHKYSRRGIISISTKDNEIKTQESEWVSQSSQLVSNRAGIQAQGSLPANMMFLIYSLAREYGLPPELTGVKRKYSFHFETLQAQSCYCILYVREFLIFLLNLGGISSSKKQ